MATGEWRLTVLRCGGTRRRAAHRWLALSLTRVLARLPLVRRLTRLALVRRLTRLLLVARELRLTLVVALVTRHLNGSLPYRSS